MDKLCNNLLETYNTNYLNMEDDEIQLKFEKESKKNKDGNKGRTTLMKLIYNHYNKTKPEPDFIAGPKTLTQHWSEKYKMMIYIFGEFHNTKHDCYKFNKFTKSNTMWIYDFLDQLFQNSVVFIDFYLEFHPKRMKFGNEYTMNHTAKQFYNKKHNLARIHYFDMRKINFHSIFSIAEFLLAFNNSSIKDKKNLLFEDKNIFKNLNILKKYNKEEVVNFIFEEVFKNPMVKKELKRSFLDGEIFDFGYNYIIKAVNKFNKLQDNINIIYDVKTNDIKFNKSYEYVFDALINMTMMTADVYALSRIFKKFKSKNIEELNSPRNIIIYAGDLHSTVYRNFLSQHGFIEIANSGYINRDPLNYETSLTNNIYACVSTRMFPMPFFNNIGQYMRKEELNKNIDKWNMNLKELLNYINTDYVYFKNKLKIENKTDFNTYSFKKDDYVLYTKRNVKAIIVFVDISSKSFHISIPSLPELGEINTIDKYLKPY